MNAFGLSSTVGRVLGIIHMNRKPMTLEELSEATGMSKTRMSQVVREMLDLNIAEKVYEKEYVKIFMTLSKINTKRLFHCLQPIGHVLSVKTVKHIRKRARNCKSCLNRKIYQKKQRIKSICFCQKSRKVLITMIGLAA